MKNLLFWLLPAFGPFLRLNFGGDSTSTSETKNLTEVRDMRVVGGEASTNISANNSAITVTPTDYGAIREGTALAAIGLNTADKTFALSTRLVDDTTKRTLDAGLSMFTGALGAIGKSSSEALSAVSDARQDVAGAYSNAVTPENGMLKIAGFVVVGIAAVSLFAGKFK